MKRTNRMACVVASCAALAMASCKPTSEVNMERLAEAFEDFVSQHSEGEEFDEAGFAGWVNDKSMGIYTGDTPLSVSQWADGSIWGYKDINQNKNYDGAPDEVVFKINLDAGSKEVVTSDEEDRHYRRRTRSGFFFLYISRTSVADHSSVHNRRWSAPANAKYMKSGYYGSSVRSGSKTSSRRGSKSGGFGFGK